MASLQMVDRPVKRHGHDGPARFLTVPESPEAPQPVLADDLSQAISEAAYYRAQARGFAPGHEMEDWISAEREVIAWHYPVGGLGRA